jgi:hypothetical protein
MRLPHPPGPSSNESRSAYAQCYAYLNPRNLALPTVEQRRQTAVSGPLATFVKPLEQ